MNYREFNRLVDKYADNLYRFILKSIKIEDDAKDIVQESFKRLWQNRNKFEQQKAKSYLFKIAYNLIIDFQRAKTKYKQWDEADYNSFSTDKTYSDLSEILDKALETLKPMYKNLILLRDYEAYSYNEISEITGLSESQVKVYIFRARKKLKDYIGKIENII